MTGVRAKSVVLVGALVALPMAVIAVGCGGEGTVEDLSALKDAQGQNADDLGANATDPQSQAQAQSGGKVTICHYPPGNRANRHTITVGASAVPAHVHNHGDTIGACGSVPGSDGGTVEDGGTQTDGGTGHDGGVGQDGGTGTGTDAGTVCGSTGSSCTASAQCCSGLTCNISTGQTVGACGAPPVCRGLGVACSDNHNSCCSPLSCVDTQLNPCGPNEPGCACNQGLQ